MLHLVHNTINYLLFPTRFVRVIRTAERTSNLRQNRYNTEVIRLSQCILFLGVRVSGNQKRRDENKRHAIAPILPIWCDRRERIAVINELCISVKRQPTHKWHIWFLPMHKPKPKKPKEPFFATARQKVDNFWLTI